ncbi:MAG: choice-of-anchor I family protein [Limnobacter sp.]|nr:choice-of-anchor I family protein [Limnobacter sp.]
MFKQKFALLSLSVVLGLSACNSDDTPVDVTPNTLKLSLLSRFENNGAAEITAYHAPSQRAFVVNGTSGQVDVLDLSKPASPTLLRRLSVSDLGGGVNSVAISGNLVALAIEASNKQANGLVLLLNATTLERISTATVGALPDMLTFTPDGKSILVANEGEPNSYGQADSVDPVGSVSIVNVTDPARPTVATAGFTQFNSQADQLRAQGIRIYGPNATVAQDLEPEYITTDAEGRKAYVALQENNAFAVIDIATATVERLTPFGFKDHSVVGNELDASDRDNGISIVRRPVLGMYQPDAIAYYQVDGQGYLLTANEGDARDYTGFAEEARVSTLTLAPNFDQTLCGGNCKADNTLGRLTVTRALGSTTAGGVSTFDKLYVLGGRSMSVFKTTGELVADTGSQLENLTANDASTKNNFNASHDSNSLDNRSDNKGPEPEAVVIGQFGTKKFAFLGLERVGGVVVYDVTKPTSPSFVTYLNTRNFAGDATAMNATGGDRGPEGITFVKPSDSPTGKALLIIGNEISGTTSILQVDTL